MPPINNITILGGGLTGLTLAYRLSRLIKTLPPLVQQSEHVARGPQHAHRDTKITLIEKSGRLGGWVNSSSRVVKVPRVAGKGKEREHEDPIEVEITLEAGPRSIRPKGSAGAAYMLKLIQDLSLESSILSVSHSHPSAQNRFILSRATNRLVRLPSGLRDILGIPASGSKIQSRGGEQLEGTDVKEEQRLRKLLRRGILSDLFRSRSPAPAVPITSGYRDTTVHQLVSSTLGPNVANNLISAMVHGIYAADSRKLSVRSTFPMLWDAMYPSSSTTTKKTGSLVWNILSSSLFRRKDAPKTAEQERKAQEEADAWRGLGPLDAERKTWSVYGLKGGLGVLTDRMEEEVLKANVDVVRHCTVDDIHVGSEGQVKLSITPESDSETSKSVHETSLLISTLNPSTLEPLLATKQRLPHLTANPSTNVGLVNLVYPLPSRQIHPDGFGYLVPRAPEDDGLAPPPPATASIPNNSGVIGVIFDSATLPVDASPDAAEHVTKLTLMMGGPHWTNESHIPTDTETLVAQAQEHLKSVFPVLEGVEPVAVRAWIHRNCIPTYLPGHGARLRELHEILSRHATDESAWAGKLVLTGSGYGGVGVNDCVGSAEGVARALMRQWGSAPGSQVGKVTGLERWENWE